MATWSETRAHLKKTFTIAAEDAEWIGLGWKFKSVRTTEDVLQRQRIELAQALGEPQLLITCDIIEVHRVPMRVALEHNATLAVGAIAISNDWYVMKHVMPLENLDFAQLNRTLEFLAHESARLRDNTPAIQ